MSSTEFTFVRASSYIFSFFTASFNRNHFVRKSLSYSVQKFVLLSQSQVMHLYIFRSSFVSQVSACKWRHNHNLIRNKRRLSPIYSQRRLFQHIYLCEVLHSSWLEQTFCFCCSQRI